MEGIKRGLCLRTSTAHVPGGIEPLPLSSSSRSGGCAVTEEVTSCQRAGSHAGQDHRRVTATHHTGEGGCHGYVVRVYNLGKVQKEKVTLNMYHV